MAVNLPGMPSGTGAAIGVTVTAGILTLLTSSNWWSYAMAAGFAAALLTYASLLVQAVNARAPGLPE
ncbi:MAG: hypothetical protein J2P34_01240, partial [Actinobacteria bacterium]|nr:hypothetical protein [Actinomycetota bacterium]